MGALQRISKIQIVVVPEHGVKLMWGLDKVCDWPFTVDIKCGGVFGEIYGRTLDANSTLDLGCKTC